MRDHIYDKSLSHSVVLVERFGPNETHALRHIHAVVRYQDGHVRLGQEGHDGNVTVCIDL